MLVGFVKGGIARRKMSELEEGGQEVKERTERPCWKSRAGLFDLWALTPESEKRGKRRMRDDLPTSQSRPTHPPLSPLCCHHPCFFVCGPRGTEQWEMICTHLVLG